MSNPYTAAAVRRLLGFAAPIKPVSVLTEKEVDNVADKEAAAISTANGVRVKFNRQIEKRYTF